jgi:serine/threonine protein kinase
MKPTPFLFAGRYECIKQLGDGQFSIVYLARDRAQNGEEVAIKIFCEHNRARKGATVASRDARFRFAHEVELLFLLNSPYIVRPYYAGTSKEGVQYLVMEHLKGETLRAKLRKGPVSVLHALEWTNMLLEGLEVIHQEGIIHRDLTPRNLVLDTSGQPTLLKIIDFGIARSRASFWEKVGDSMGTPLYCSPEQLRAEPLTLASDIYAVGLLLHEWLLGTVPHTRASDGDVILMKRAFEEVPSPNADTRTLPDDLAVFLMKALAHDPNQRFASGMEMKKAFAPLYERYAGVAVERRVEVDSDVAEDFDATVEAKVSIKPPVASEPNLSAFSFVVSGPPSARVELGKQKKVQIAVDNDVALPAPLDSFLAKALSPLPDAGFSSESEMKEAFLAVCESYSSSQAEIDLGEDTLLDRKPPASIDAFWDFTDLDEVESAALALFESNASVLLPQPVKMTWFDKVRSALSSWWESRSKWSKVPVY